jgi:hypothetical protein
MTRIAFRSARWTRIFALVCALVLVPVGQASVSGAVGPPVASDLFGRSVSAGWGAADLGGAYTYDGDAAAFGVNGTTGTMSLPSAAANVAALLRGVSLRDVDVRFRVSAGRPAGGALFMYVMVRQGTGSEYRPKVLFNPDGTVSAHAGLIINGAESSLGRPVVVPGVTQAPGAFLWVRTRVTGASPTTVHVKVWPQGVIEPAAWQFTATDSSAAVQDAGSVGFRVYLNSTVTNAPVNVAFDDVMVASLDGGPRPSVTVAADTFERANAGSWGVSTTGGIYSYDGRLSDYSVAGGRGQVRLPSAGHTRSTFLLSSWAKDVDMSFAVSPDKLAAGDSFFAYGTLRRATDGSAYRLRLRFASGGGVFAQGVRFTPKGGVAALGAEVRVSGLPYGPNSIIRAHVRAVGSNPTTLQIRAWPDGQPEPASWAFTATDATANLQSAGALGLVGYLAPGATNAPLIIRFDDLLVTTTDPVGRLAGATFVGAGDIAVCNGDNDEATATLLDMIDGTVFTVGDNVYPDATALEFANCYEPTWGRHKARTYPAVGNHEYHAAPDAGPYFDYFGAVAGQRGKGWYAYDVGTWRVYVLNSNCDDVACTVGSAQEQWLRADLAANPRPCSLAIWHAPRFSSGSDHGSSASVQAFWQDLFNAGAELVLSGHSHHYERFAPMNGAGAVDNDNGLRQFVIGTGGAGMVSGFPTVAPNSQVRQAWSPGVLKLTLGTNAFEWEFIPIAGETFSDRGSGNCH